jgi:hypothetical protein
VNLYKNNNISYFFGFLIIWLIVFIIEYFYRDGIPLFICNDSYQYLDIAQNIYQNKTLNGLIKYALNIYYDEIAHFKYDLGDLKPYHFPSYSIYLSLFYHIYDNHNFVIYFSQYIAFMIFSIASFLIFNQFISKKTSFILTILTMFTTSIVLYISDCGKEILFSGLSLLVFYFGIYSPYRQKISLQILMCFLLTFMSITRNFYLLQALIIVIYNNFSFKFLEKNPLIIRKISHKILYIILIFLIPLIAYFYCYHVLQYHLFLFNNRTDIYGGNSFNDLILRIFSNGFFSCIWLFPYFFQRIIDPNNYSMITLFPLTVLWLIALTTIAIWLISKLKLFIKIKKIFFRRDDLIFAFYATMILLIIIRFSANGFRLTMGFMPFAYLFFYQNFIKNNKFKYFLYFFIFTLFVYLMDFNRIYHNYSRQNYQKNLYIKELIAKFDARKVVIDASFFQFNYLLPIYYYFNNNIYFFSFFNPPFLCDELQNYKQHFIDFDMIFVNYEQNLFLNYSTDNCRFINDNFQIVDINKYGYAYLNKSKIPSSYHLK